VLCRQNTSENLLADAGRWLDDFFNAQDMMFDLIAHKTESQGQGRGPKIFLKVID